jgi:NDP-sugar pyrophosphorylase family protein
VIKYALIMAAGRGSRMMPLTAALPKAMAPYDQSTLIAQGIQAISQYVPNVYVTVGYKGNILADHVISQGIRGLFDTSERDNAWWIFNTLMSCLDEPVYVLTCDNVVSLNFSLIEADYYRLGSPACMVVPVKPVSGLDGDYISQANNVITKLSRDSPTTSYCSGIQVLNPFHIAQMMPPQDDFYGVWSNLIIHQQLKCSSVYPEKWFVADTLQQLLAIPPRSDLFK